MRIAFLTPEFITEPSFAGGLAQYLGRVTKGLVQRGHKVEVFVISDTHDTIENYGVVVHRVPRKKWMPLRFVNMAARITHVRPFCKMQLACSTALGLQEAYRRRICETKFDIVQAASWLGTGFFAATSSGCPVVIRASSYEPLLFPYRGNSQSLDEAMYGRFETAAMRRAAAVYTPSRFLAGKIKKMTGIQAHVINPPYYATNGLLEDAGSLEQLSDWPDYLLYFGKIAKYKGAGLLAEALMPLVNDGSPLRLAIAGAAESDCEAAKLLSLAKTHPAHVRYLGCLKHDLLMSVVRRSRFVVLPSLMDNMPNTCIEAMGMQKVVVAPDGASFDELIQHGESGFLFRIGDASALRRSILQVWDLTDERRSTTGVAAAARLRHMAPEITLSHLERFYADVIANASATERRTQVRKPCF